MPPLEFNVSDVGLSRSAGSPHVKASAIYMGFLGLAHLQYSLLGLSGKIFRDVVTWRAMSANTLIGYQLITSHNSF